MLARKNDTELPPTLYDHSLVRIDGDTQELSELRGKVLLIANVASRCGFTPQYAELEQLHQDFAQRGLVVMGVPSGDFFQELASNRDIEAFCTARYGVTFPMYEKTSVRGRSAHPLFRWLTAHGGKVSWNFNKFLVGRDGQLIQRFGARVSPNSHKLRSAVEAALG